MTVEFPGGKEIEYKVPVIRVQEYTKEEIFEKKLYLFFPYYIMRYENELKEVEASEEKQQKLLCEYDEICRNLSEALIEQHPDIYSRLLGLMRKVSNYVLRKNKNLRKGMGDLMGGKVLELETDWFSDPIREARISGRNVGKKIGEKIGKEIGRKAEKASLISAMLSNGMSAEEISRMCNLDLEEVKQISSM